MSDFDKEAERERLREKYERDQEKRKATQHMSELLLKGATMTNRHCGECGDPIFRYDGQEFCPTCQEVTAEGEAEAEATPGEAETAPGGVETPAAGDEATAGGEPTPDGVDAGQRGGDGVEVEVDRPEGRSPAANGRTGADRRSRSPEHQRVAEPTPSARAGDETGVEEARASLVRTLTRFAREAESASDPRRAREALAASREAAEALAALDRR